MHEQDINNHNLREVEELYIMATTDTRVGGRGMGAQNRRVAEVVWGFQSSTILKALRAIFFISFVN